uniref:Uncharacterized protein n=1 Tax=Arundo donax TaxID=35708 RepID=A0A0A9D6E7_ARUDO
MGVSALCSYASVFPREATHCTSACQMLHPTVPQELMIGGVTLFLLQGVGWQDLARIINRSSSFIIVITLRRHQFEIWWLNDLSKAPLSAPKATAAKAAWTRCIW